MNATSAVNNYLEGNERRFQAWRDERLSVPFSERAEARTTSPDFPAARLDARLMTGRVSRRRWTRGLAVPEVCLALLAGVHVLLVLLGVIGGLMR